MTGPDPQARTTEHWRIESNGTQQQDVHLVLTPIAGHRLPDLSAMLRDEREDLFETVRRELRDCGVDRYQVLMVCRPGRAMQVHVTSLPDED